jgi:hypothetical protein
MSVVQPAASRYTDCAIQAPRYSRSKPIYKKFLYTHEEIRNYIILKASILNKTDWKMSLKYFK